MAVLLIIGYVAHVTHDDGALSKGCTQGFP